MKSPKKNNLSLRYTKSIKDYEKHIKSLIYDYKLFQTMNMTVSQFESLVRTNSKGKMINTNISQKQWHLLDRQEKTDVKEIAQFVSLLYLHRKHIKQYELNAANWQRQKEAAARRYDKAQKKYKEIGEKWAKEKAEREKKKLERAKQKEKENLAKKLDQERRYKALINDTIRQRLNNEIKQLRKEIDTAKSRMDKWEADRFNDMSKQITDLLKQADLTNQSVITTRDKNIPPDWMNSRYLNAYAGSLLAPLWEDAYEKAMEMYHAGIIQRSEIWSTVRRLEKENYVRLKAWLHQLKKINKHRVKT